MKRIPIATPTGCRRGNYIAVVDESRNQNKSRWRGRRLRLLLHLLSNKRKKATDLTLVHLTIISRGEEIAFLLFTFLVSSFQRSVGRVSLVLWFAETLIPHSFYSSPTPNCSGCVQRDRNNQTEFPFRISGIRPPIWIIQIRASGGWWGPLPEQQLSELQMYLLLLHNIYRWLDYVERHHIICPDISHNSIRSSLPCLLVWCRTLNEWTPDVTYSPR